MGTTWVSDRPSSTFTISADGSHHWGLSTLKRMTDTAMEWATGLVMKAIDVGAPILALRAARLSFLASGNIFGLAYTPFCWADLSYTKAA